MGIIPNLFTFLNLLCGVQAIYLTLNRQWYSACGFILLCVLFDGLDGKIAKWLNQETEFGRFFDAFSDLVSFAIMPSLLLYHLADAYSIAFLKWAALLYFLSGFFRLIRFYISRSEIEYFEGMPTTAAAAILALEILFIKQPVLIKPLLLYSGILLSFLMISSIPFPNPKSFLFAFFQSKRKT